MSRIIRKTNKIFLIVLIILLLALGLFFYLNIHKSQEEMVPLKDYNERFSFEQQKN